MFMTYFFFCGLIVSTIAAIFFNSARVYGTHSVDECDIYFSYGDSNLLRIDYHDFNIIDFFDFDNHVAYKYCGSCKAGTYNASAPNLYRLPSDVVDSSGKAYRSNGIISYIWFDANNIVSKFQLRSNNKIFEFINTPKPIDNFVPSWLTSCPKPVCSNVILDVVFVFDESGSITEYEFDQLRNYALTIVNSYNVNDKEAMFGIVLFAEDANVILPLSSNLQLITSSLSLMKQRKGGTCIACGVEAATNMLNSIPNSRRALKPKQFIITMTDGEANRPKTSSTKSPCYSYGGCKPTCSPEIRKQLQSTSYSYICTKNYDRSTKTCYANSKGTAYAVKNNMCFIEGSALRNDCCANGADDCCCQSVAVDGGCYTSGSYNSSANQLVADYSKKSGIRNIVIGVRDSVNINQLKIFADNSNDILLYSNYDDLLNNTQNLVSTICVRDDYVDCYSFCSGFCTCGNKCICPSCIKSSDSCITYSCRESSSNSTGCVKSDVSCKDFKCLHTLKNSSDPSCCTYSDIDCTDYSNLCKIPKCSNISGCFYDYVSCDNSNKCLSGQCNPSTGKCEYVDVKCFSDDKCFVPACNPFVGCYTVPLDCNDHNSCTVDYCSDGVCVHDLINCSVGQICTSISNTEYKCVDGCFDDSNCPASDKCGSWSCIDGKCVFSSSCLNQKCKVFTGCSDGTCFYDDVNCSSDNKCIDAYCSDDKCVYDNVDCSGSDLCKNYFCDKLTGCYSEDIVCNDVDLCHTNYRCVDGQCVSDIVNCSSDDVCNPAFCDDTIGCYTKPVDCSVDDPCVVSYCADINGEAVCLSDPKCTSDDICLTASCNLDGSCSLSNVSVDNFTYCSLFPNDIICSNYSYSECYTFSCFNNSVSKNIINISILSPCSFCFDVFKLEGMVFNISNETCTPVKKVLDPRVVMTAGVIAAIAVASAIAAVGISAGSVKATKELVKFARKVADSSVHSNPLYENAGNEGSNPLYDGTEML